MSKFIHDPSNRCFVDSTGVNFLELLADPVLGRRFVVSDGGILCDMRMTRCLTRLSIGIEGKERKMNRDVLRMNERKNDAS